MLSLNENMGFFDRLKSSGHFDHLILVADILSTTTLSLSEQHTVNLQFHNQRSCSFFFVFSGIGSP